MTLDLDPDRKLALAYVPAPVRPAMDALWRLDVSLGAVLATGREPLISQIRLAWWRESLQKLDVQKAPAEPVLQAIAQHLIPCGILGEELSQLESGWAVLVAPEPLDSQMLDNYALGRGAALFQLSARLLGEPGPLVTSAGMRWALVDLARHSGEPDAKAAFAAANVREPVSTWPARLRPLGMLSALASRDLDRGQERMERQGSPGRMWRMLAHRLSGR